MLPGLVANDLNRSCPDALYASVNARVPSCASAADGIKAAATMVATASLRLRFMRPLLIPAPYPPSGGPPHVLVAAPPTRVRRSDAGFCRLGSATRRVTARPESGYTAGRRRGWPLFPALPREIG